MPAKPDGKRYKHEDYSTGLIEHVLTDVIDRHSLNSMKITAEEICRFLKNEVQLPAQILFWRPLITGQMDADRADYLLRDSYHAGVAYGQYDLNRLVATLRVVRDRESGALRIGVDRGGIQAVEGLILARYMMFVQVYFHHARRAFDRHVTRTLAFLLEEAYGDDFGHARTFPPPTSAENLNRYLAWTDHRVWHAIDSDRAGLDGNLIKTRRHDRCVHQTSLFPETKDVERLHEEILPTVRECGAWVDKADSSWYKFDKPSDIPIATSDTGIDDHPVPLSSQSSLIQALEQVTQRRVYVPFGSKEKAKDLLGI